MKYAQRHYYLRELKQVSYTLFHHQDWDGFRYKDIKNGLIKFDILYPSMLDDYVREEAAYGCPIREEAYQLYIKNIAQNAYPNISRFDRKLGTTLHHHRQHPDDFPPEDAQLFKRIRLLAEDNANYNNVELCILKETPYDPRNGVGRNQQFTVLHRMHKENGEEVTFDDDEHNRILTRPIIMQYIPGVTDETIALHHKLVSYHKRYGYDA